MDSVPKGKSNEKAGDGGGVRMGLMGVAFFTSESDSMLDMTCNL